MIIMNNKYIKTLILVAAFLILTLLTVASYAYFSASVSGNSTAEETIITSGNMALLLTDGEQVSLNNAFPGTTITKSFKVKNVGTVSSTYDVYLSELINTFADKNDLVYILESTNGCPNNSETIVPSEVGEQSKIVSSCSINPNIEHEYTLTITFKEDGTNQDDNKDKHFRSKISINEYKEGLKTISETMIINKNNGETDLEYDGVETIGEYGTKDNNLRYIGENPSNYIYYNCSTTDIDEMNDTTCEKWRIIGLMNNLEDKNSKVVSNVKIIKDDSIGIYAWDSSEESVKSGMGLTQWGETVYEDGTPYEGADLMRELNTDYLGNITVGTDGKWFAGEKNSKKYDDANSSDGNMPSILLNNNSINMINEVKWYSASDGRTYYDRTVSEMYELERGDIISSYYYVDHLNRINQWIGKVALPYPSDFIYSLLKENQDNKYDNFDPGANYSVRQFKFEETYESNGEMHSYTNSKHGDSWLFTKNGALTLTTTVYESYCNACVLYTDQYNFSLQYPAASYHYGTYVYPTLHLKNEVYIVSGDGTSTNPYKLTM